MVPGKLFFMDGFQESDRCPGRSQWNRQRANQLPDPIIAIIGLMTEDDLKTKLVPTCWKGYNRFAI
jgi:hypothetical protein